MKKLLLFATLAAFAVAARAGDGQACSDSQHTSCCAKSKIMTSTTGDCPECPMAAQIKAKVMTSAESECPECPMAAQTKAKLMTSTKADCQDCPMTEQTKANCPYAAKKFTKHSAKPLLSPKALALASR